METLFLETGTHMACKVHPVVLLSVLDHYLRRHEDQNRVIGKRACVPPCLSCLLPFLCMCRERESQLPDLQLGLCISPSILCVCTRVTRHTARQCTEWRH